MRGNSDERGAERINKRGKAEGGRKTRKKEVKNREHKRRGEK